MLKKYPKSNRSYIRWFCMDGKCFVHHINPNIIYDYNLKDKSLILNSGFKIKTISFLGIILKKTKILYWHSNYNINKLPENDGTKVHV